LRRTNCGLDGALVTDITVEESTAYRKLCIPTIGYDLLAAPTSTDARLRKLQRRLAGFIYAVSRTE